MLEIDEDGARFLGFKLTGDALYTAVTDLSARVLHTEGEELPSREVPDVVALMAATTRRLQARFERLPAIGVCLAGDVRRVPGDGAVVSGSAFLGWDDTPLQALLEEATGLPVTVSNDVQALTAAHHWFGAGNGASSLAVIGMGAGIGCGLVLGDVRIDGANGHPGKVGHLPVGLDETLCDAGHPGCVSSYVTVPAILRNSGAPDFRAAMDAAAARDERALSALRRASIALGAVIAALANLIDPERVVVTGEALDVARWQPELVEEAVRARLDPASVVPRIVCADFEFTDYAWGAAVTAVHSLI